MRIIEYKQLDLSRILRGINYGDLMELVNTKYEYPGLIIPEKNIKIVNVRD